MNPQSVNPVLKQKIEFTLEQTFPYTLQKTDFTVFATSKTNSSYTRPMNVIGVDDSTKKVTVMFGGAWSGKFAMTIRHKNFGLLDTSSLELDVAAYVDSISPS
jgi:hypothetical protein